MDDKMKVGGVEYQKKDTAYFEKRKLKRVAGPWRLWALGVGAVISGDFSGWNLGLAQGGFGGLLIATVLIATMYLMMCYSLAEMAPALPHTGGAYSFARTSMGPWGGFITGMAENIEYIFTPAVVVFFATSYLQGVIEGVPILSAIPDWGWWAILYILFLSLNIAGAATSFALSLFLTLISLAVLCVFFIGAIPHFDVSHLFNIPPVPEKGGTTFLPFGNMGILLAMPFAVWFFLAIEELPLAAEESHVPQKDLPRGILWGIGTLIVTAIGVLTLNPGIPPGAEVIGKSGEPILEGFKTIFGDIGSRVLGLIAVAGLLASFHCIIYAFGRQIYSLSRAGYFPSFLSLTNSRTHAPSAALITGGILGYAALIVLKFAGGEEKSATLIGGQMLSVAVFGAMISYFLQMISFIILRVKYPNIERPYRSPFGVPGAVVAMIIAAVTLVTLFITDPMYRVAAVAAACWFFLGILYFVFVSRNNLILSPEESFALKAKESGTKGHTISHQDYHS